MIDPEDIPFGEPAPHPYEPLDEVNGRIVRACVACNTLTIEIEYHHWAPRSIFPDWPYELGVDLCTTCHRHWHDKMREHGLRWPHER